MLNTMKKVVKCNECRQYFMYTEKDVKCPFCHIEYAAVEEETKEKRGTAKTQKKSFKIWKDS